MVTPPSLGAIFSYFDSCYNWVGTKQAARGEPRIVDATPVIDRPG